MKRIAIALYDQALGTSISLPMEMLQAAIQTTKVSGKAYDDYKMVTVGLNTESVTTGSGISITPHEVISDASFDVIFLPSMWRSPRHNLKRYNNYIPWLISQHEQGAIICGAGTGAFFMAETGLLDFKAATTHWFYFNQFEIMYPNISMQKNHFITKEANLYCAGSLNAVADLTIHIIERLFDKRISQHVESQFSNEVRSSFQHSAFLYEKTLAHSYEDILQVQAWLQKNYNEAINIESLADKFNLSVRSFNRRFKDASQQTPKQYIQQLRIDAAKELLKKTNLSIGDISTHVGYQDVSYFSELFKKHLSTTPKVYRLSVRNKLFRLDD
jgi:transcriptional regulator GlxA family with amidase domain